MSRKQLSGFESAYAEMEADLRAIRISGDRGEACIVPVCGGVALTKGSVSGSYTIRMGGDVFVKLGSKESAAAYMERAIWRLKLAWLSHLEEENDDEGLKRYEAIVGQMRRDDDDLEDKEEEPRVDMEFFEPFENTTST